MSASDTSLPFFGVQARARGERVSLRERTIGLAPTASDKLRDSSDRSAGVIRVAASLAVLLYRYTYEPTVVIGMAEPVRRVEGTHPLGIVPMRISVDANDTLPQVISKSAEAVGRARAGADRVDTSPGSDCPTPVVLAMRNEAEMAPSGGPQPPEPSDWHAGLLRATDLLIEIREERGAPTLRVIYDALRFNDECIARFADQLATTLSNLSSDSPGTSRT